MSMKQRVVAAVVSGVLAGVLGISAVVLYELEAEISFPDGVVIRCDSVLEAGSRSTFRFDDSSSRSYTYDVIRGEAPTPTAEERRRGASLWETRDRMELVCDQKRTRNAADMSLLLAPAAVLAMLSLHLWLTRRQGQPLAGRAHQSPAGHRLS